MESKLIWEIKTLRTILQAGVEVMNSIERQNEGITKYSAGWRDGRQNVVEYLDRILKEVSE